MKRTKVKLISETLRRALADSGQNIMELEQATGVDNGILSRFLRDERSITLPTADKLARHLGLELVQRERRRK